MSNDVNVVVYDPNSTNPYGREVAALLSDDAIHESVLLLRPRGAAPSGLNLAELRTLSDPASNSANRVAAAFRRFRDPIKTAIAARGAVLLICWVRDPWDALVFTIRARLGGSSVVVYHNPRQIRPRPGLVGRLEQILLRSSTVLVHSEDQRHMVSGDFPNAIVVLHPPYTAMAAIQNDTDLIRSDHFAYVGRVRADKGAAELRGLAGRAQHNWTIRFIGTGPVDDDLKSALEAGGLTVENRPEHYEPDDDVLVRAFRECAGLLAPYTAVSTSGTMLLAASLGKPIWTFESVPTDGIPDALVRKGKTLDDLAESLDTESQLGPRAEPHVEATSYLVQWRESARASWLEALRRVEHPGR